jgi:hypothetical protein
MKNSTLINFTFLDVIFFILGLFFTMAVGGLGFFIYLKTDGSSCKKTSFCLSFFLERHLRIEKQIDAVFSSLFFFKHRSSKGKKRSLCWRQ